MTGHGRKLHSEELNDLFSPNMREIDQIKEESGGRLVCMEKGRGA